MAAAKTVVPDPNVTIGPYRILQRTDWKYIIYDERRPVPDRAVQGDDGQPRLFKTIDEAKAAARKLPGGGGEHGPA